MGQRNALVIYGGWNKNNLNRLLYLNPVSRLLERVKRCVIFEEDMSQGCTLKFHKAPVWPVSLSLSSLLVEQEVQLGAAPALCLSACHHGDERLSI